MYSEILDEKYEKIKKNSKVDEILTVVYTEIASKVR